MTRRKKGETPTAPTVEVSGVMTELKGTEIDMKDSKKPAIFQARNANEELALRVHEVIANLVTAAKDLDCEGDDKNYEPVTLLICAVIVARRELDDLADLHCLFHEMEAMIEAIEKASNGQIHPERIGLMASAKALSRIGHQIADVGVGCGRNQADPLVVRCLLGPYMPREIDGLIERSVAGETVEA